ncbi:MAG: beta-ketoacyl synthase N-terminal-like domain-containing protein, partial [Gemmataceae bacterium]
MPHRRRIVLTGMGVVSPLGLDRTTFVEALRQRRSGLRAIRHFDATGLPIRIAGELPNFQGRNYLQKKDRKLLKMMAPTVQQAVASARLAIDDAGLKIDDSDPSRLGVVLGIGIIPGEIMDLGPAAHASFDQEADRLDLRRWGHEGMAEMQPMWMLNHVPNMSACHVSILNNAQGPNNTITQSDVASLLAV